MVCRLISSPFFLPNLEGTVRLALSFGSRLAWQPTPSGRPTLIINHIAAFLSILAPAGVPLRLRELSAEVFGEDPPRQGCGMNYRTASGAVSIYGNHSPRLRIFNLLFPYILAASGEVL